MKRILVIGSSGMLGRPVTSQLIRSGFSVRLLSRDPGKTTGLFPNAEICQGDVFDLDSLVSCMRDIDTVYVNLSVLQNSKEKDPQPEREGVQKILSAAGKTGVKRIAYLSSLIKNYQGMNGFNWWAFRIKQAAIDSIRRSGIPFTIFYPSTFMETFPYQMIRGNKIMMLGHSEAPMWFIAAEDYGKQVSRALEQNSNDNREYVVQGPEAFTFDEAAQVIMRHCSREKLNVMKAPLGLIRFAGRFIPRLSYGANICEALNKYPEKFESERTWQELGKPTIRLEEFAAALGANSH